MYSPEMMKFLIGRDIEEFDNNEKEKAALSENKIFRWAKYATVPIEIKD